MAWQGVFAGATQALSWIVAATCVTVNVTIAWPSESVGALAALSVPEPSTTLKFTVTLFCGAPLLRTRAVSGTPTVAPWAIQRKGLKTPMSEADSVAKSAALTDFDGL